MQVQCTASCENIAGPPITPAPPHLLPQAQVDCQLHVGNLLQRLRLLHGAWEAIE